MAESMTSRLSRLTLVETVLLFAGAACIAIALALAGIRFHTAEHALAPICKVGDVRICAESGRRIAATDLENGLARYFLVGLVTDTSDAERAFASVGIRLVPAGCLCCDPLQMAYNQTIRDWLAGNHSGFVIPLAIY